MKINIGYKLSKKKIANRKVYLLFLTFFVILELLTFIKDDEKQKEIQYSVRNESNESKLNDVIEKLNEKDITFISAKKENETYLLDVIIEGSKEEFLKKINSLDNYNINDYNIEFNHNLVVGRLTLNYSPRGEF